MWCSRRSPKSVLNREPRWKWFGLCGFALAAQRKGCARGTISAHLPQIGIENASCGEQLKSAGTCEMCAAVCRVCGRAQRYGITDQTGPALPKCQPFTKLPEPANGGAGMLPYVRLADPLACLLPALAARGYKAAGFDGSLGERQRRVGEGELVVVVAFSQVDQCDAVLG